MDVTGIDPIWWIVLGVVVVLLIGLLMWSGRRKSKRTRRLKSQFKSEYDRAAGSGSRKQAEEQLERRLARRREVDLTDLDDTDADTMFGHIDELLRSFVDGPQGAARGMTQLVGRIATARGYVATEEGVLDLVSVDHPEQVAELRRALTEMERAKGGDLTEASRQVFLDARTLAERLLAEARAGQLADEYDPSPLPPPPVEEAPSEVYAEPSSDGRPTTYVQDAPDPGEPPSTTGSTPFPEWHERDPDDESGRRT